MTDDNGTPRAPEAEKQVVASVLLLPEIFPEVAAIVRPVDFFEAPERATFQAMHDLHFAGKPIEQAMLLDSLRGLPDFGTESPAGYLLELAQSVATAAHAPHYAKEIVAKREKRDRLRQLDAWGEQYRNGHATEDIDKELFATSTDWLKERQADQPRDTFSFQDLASTFPNNRPVLIDGVARIGDVINIIANTKVGKSWFVYYLALCIITQRYLFGRFATTGGKVLICDNELHAETLAARIPVVASAMGIMREEYEQKLVVKILRGNLRSFGEVASEIREQFEPGEFALIVFDAKYRFAQPGQSENDNASEAMFYNECDRFSVGMQTATALVHHASKGSQSEKRASDVGAGAGAQSRAADVHAIFREHEDDGAFVFEALVRSFAPVEPIGLRWIFPLWVPDSDVDPGMLKGRLSPNEEKQAKLDRDGMDTTLTALVDGQQSARALRRKTGFGESRQNRVLDLLTAGGLVVFEEKQIGKRTFNEYRLKD